MSSTARWLLARGMPNVGSDNNGHLQGVMSVFSKLARFLDSSAGDTAVAAPNSDDSPGSVTRPLPHGWLARERQSTALELETALRAALRYNELELHYQPQLDLSGGDLLSIEAVVCWRRPGMGLASAREFMPLADALGLSSSIADWTLAAAAQQAARWDRAGLPPFGIALNVSAQQFHAPGFVQRLERILREQKLSPHRLELEFSESVLMHDSDRSIDILKQLRDLGSSLCIDEFGTGYSSLGYLRRFQIDEIKIDRSFVQAMASDESALRVVRGMIELAHSLKFHVIADGLDNTEQLQRLLDLRCDRAQGGLIARPLSGAALIRANEEWPQRWRTMTG